MVYNKLSDDEEDGRITTATYGKTDDQLIEVRFSGTNLADKDFLSLSDPFLVCHILHKGRKFEYVGETETIMDDINPEWMTSFIFKKSILLNPKVQFICHLFDEDSPHKSKLTKHDFLGMASFRLSDLNLNSAFSFTSKIGPSDSNFYTLNSDNSNDKTFRISVDSKLYAKKQKQQRQHQILKKLSLEKFPFANNRSLSFLSFSSSSSLGSTNYNKISKEEEYEDNDYDDEDIKKANYDGNSLDVSKIGKKPSSKFRDIFSRRSLTTIRQDKCSVEYDLERATNTSRAKRHLSGHVNVSVEPININPGKRINLKVLCNLVVDKQSIWGNISRNPCVQFFEIHRQSADKEYWNCIYRSEDGCYSDNKNFINFNVTSLNERQLHNGVPDRLLKFKFMSRHTKSQHCLISYFDISCIDLFTLDANRFTATKLEGEFHDDIDSIGSIYLKKSNKSLQKDMVLSPPGSNTNEYNFILKAEHFISKRFVSVLDIDQRYFRKLRQIPKFISRH